MSKLKRSRTIVDSCANPTPHDVLLAALAYRRASLSLIPIQTDATKQPAFELLPETAPAATGKPKRTWGVFRNRCPTEAEIRSWFGPHNEHDEYGMAILGGKVSGNLEILDIDSGDLAGAFQEEIDARAPGLFERLVKVRSPRPGLHLYYRCETIGGNQKLARIPDPSPDSENPRAKTVIEIKGEGGYCLAPPSPRACHPTQRCYRFLADKDLTQVPTISVSERASLHDAARTFDRWQPTRPPRTPERPGKGNPRSLCGSRPGDDFNQRANWTEILVPHGWELVGDDGENVDYWRRPGKVEGVSATTNFGGSDLLYVFSTNAAPFDSEQSYTKFGAYALLEHDGDFDEAAAELRRLGYGRSQRPLSPRAAKQESIYAQHVLRSRR